MILGTFLNIVCVQKVGIARILRFSVGRKEAIVTPYLSPEDCGNRRWMGSRELFLSSNSIHTVPIDNVLQRVKVWSIVSTSLLLQRSSFRSSRYRFYDVTGRCRFDGYTFE